MRTRQATATEMKLLKYILKIAAVDGFNECPCCCAPPEAITDSVLRRKMWCTNCGMDLYFERGLTNLISAVVPCD